MKFLQLLTAFAHDKRAVTAIEYGVLAASIALGIGGLFGSDSAFMEALKGTFANITEQLQGTSE